MHLPRPVTSVAASALLAAAAVALAPAASADTGQLPGGAAVVPVLASSVTVTAAPGATPPTGASAQWTIPACSGTVYAIFLLRQRGADGAWSVYLQDKGTRAYPCQATPQTVTVRYGAADPSQGALTTGDVQLTTETYAAASGGAQTSSTSTTAKAVASSAGLPKGSSVVPRFLQGVARHADPSSPTGVSTAARWVVPACSGSVRAAFTLFQDGESSPRAAQAATTFRCSPADQVVTVSYQPTRAGAPAVHAGAADLWVDTTTRGGRLLQSALTVATAS